MEFLSKLIDTLPWGELLIAAGRILLILAAALFLFKLMRTGLARLEKIMLKRAQADQEQPQEAAKRIDTLIRLLRQTLILVIWVLVALVLLRELGVDIMPVLAGAGIVGLAVGFGAQNLVRDVISGFFMILENQVRVGDVAIVNGTGGLVEKMGLRTLVLRDLSGVVHVFPNGTVDTLANLTRDWSAYVFDIGVAYKEDADRVMDIMRRVGAEMRADETFAPLIIEDIEIFGVNEFADSAVMIKGRLKTLPIQQWSVGREFLRRLKIAFDQEGIEIPFPHRAIYFGEASKPFITQLMESRERQEE